MNAAVERYYPCGYSGDDFLSEKGSVISHSEYLENGYIRLIECDKESNTIRLWKRKRMIENGLKSI